MYLIHYDIDMSSYKRGGYGIMSRLDLFTRSSSIARASWLLVGIMLDIAQCNMHQPLLFNTCHWNSTIQSVTISSKSCIYSSSNFSDWRIQISIWSPCFMSEQPLIRGLNLDLVLQPLNWLSEPFPPSSELNWYTLGLIFIICPAWKAISVIQHHVTLYFHISYQGKYES